MPFRSSNNDLKYRFGDALSSPHLAVISVLEIIISFFLIREIPGAGRIHITVAAVSRILQVLSISPTLFADNSMPMSLRKTYRHVMCLAHTLYTCSRAHVPGGGDACSLHHYRYDIDQEKSNRVYFYKVSNPAGH